METPKPAKKNIIIVGAGFSGLTLAILLEEQKLFNIVIYEKHNFGGLLQSEISTGMLFENAAPSMLNHPELEAFLKKFDKKPVPTLKSAKKRFLFYDKISRWPMGLTASLLLGLRIIFFLLKRDKKSTLTGRTVKDWSDKYLGQEFTDKILRTAFLGIYASEIENLQAELVLSRFFEFKKSAPKPKFKGSIIPEGGLSNFMQELRKKLIKNEVQFVRKNLDFKEIISLKENNIIIFATSFAEFYNILKQKPERILELPNSAEISEWTTLSAKIKNISLVKVHLTFENIKNKINGFGILFHPKNNFSALGVIANSNLFKEYGPEYNESWILKYTGIQNILENILTDRNKIFGADEKIKSSFIKIYNDVYPIYNQDLFDWHKKTRLQPGYFATGNYWGSLGLTQIFLQNKILAERIREYAKQ